jgi:acyl carrier protein
MDRFERVKAIVVSLLGVDATRVRPEASFAEDLDADQIDLAGLLRELRHEFQVHIPDSVVDWYWHNLTVGDVLVALESAAV